MGSVVEDLDAALQQSGEDCILRRIVGTGNTVNIDVVVRAHLRRVTRQPGELVNELQTDDRRVVISPTPIREAQWPAGNYTPASLESIDPNLPARGDRLIFQGRSYRIEAVDAMSADGQIARIELYIKGGGSAG